MFFGPMSLLATMPSESVSNPYIPGNNYYSTTWAILFDIGEFKKRGNFFKKKNDMKNTTTLKNGSGEDHFLFLDVVSSMRSLVLGGRIGPVGWYKFLATMLINITKSCVSQQCSNGSSKNQTRTMYLWYNAFKQLAAQRMIWQPFGTPIMTG